MTSCSWCSPTGTCSWDTDANDWAADATAVPAPLRGAFDGEPRWVDATWTARSAAAPAPRWPTDRPARGDRGAGAGHHQGRASSARSSVSIAARSAPPSAPPRCCSCLTIAAVIGALIALDQRDKAESRRQQALSQSLAGQATERRQPPARPRHPPRRRSLASRPHQPSRTSPHQRRAVDLARRGAIPRPGQRFVGLELVAVPEHGYALAGRSDGSLDAVEAPVERPEHERSPKSPESPHRASIAAFVARRVGRTSRLGRRVRPRGGVGRGDARDARDVHDPAADHGWSLDADLTADGKHADGLDAGRRAALGPRSAGPACVVAARRQRRRRSRYAAMSSDGTHVGATIQGADGTVRDRDLEPHRRNREPYQLPRRTRHRSSTCRSRTTACTSARFDIFGGSAAYRVADGVNVAYPHAGGWHHDADRRSARRDGARPRPLVHLRQWQRERAGLERGNVAGARDAIPSCSAGARARSPAAGTRSSRPTSPAR